MNARPRLSAQEWRQKPAAEIGLFPGATPKEVAYLWPFCLFKPSPAFAPFILSAHPRMIWRAGNRIGKSEHGAARLVFLALARPGTRYRAIGPTFGHTVDVIGAKLKALIPPFALCANSVYDKKNGWSGKLIQLKNGSTIQIRSYDQDPLAHSGDALHGVWFDEAPPRAILDENLGRLMDYGGWALITITPINAPCGYLKELVEKGAWHEHVISFSADSAPWYTPQQIADRIAECLATPSTYGQRIHGDWEGTTADRHFSGFDPTRHVLRDDRPYDVFRVGMDHGKGENRQVGYLIGVTWRTDGRRLAERLHVLREYKSGQAGQTAALIAEGLYGLLTSYATPAGLSPEHVIGLAKAYGDSNSSGLDEVGTFNDKINLELRDLAPGLRLRAPVKVAGARENGEALLNERALADRLTVDPSCTLLIQALSHYRQGKEAYKDPIDALRYATYDTLARV